MAPAPRSTGKLLPKWLGPAAILVIAIVLVLGTQMKSLPRGVAIVSAPKDRQLQARDIGGVETSLTNSPPFSDRISEEEPALVNIEPPTTKSSSTSPPINTIKGENDDEEEEFDYEEDYDYEEQNENSKDIEKQPIGAVDEQKEDKSEHQTTDVVADKVDLETEETEKEIEEPIEEEEETTSTSIAPSSSIVIDTSRRFPPDMPFIQAIATCDSFECVRDAHRQPRRGARFNFPHFMIIGWQKSATTSLYVHLVRHKFIARPAVKEPEFFSKECRFRIERCTPEDTKNYLHNTLNYTAFLDHGGNIGTFEASTHYIRGHDRLPQGLYEIFPWVKLIIMMREPISRAMSMLIHNREATQVGCLMEKSMAECLLTNSQISGDREFPRSINYTRTLNVWLENFPAGQVQVLQYEEIVSAPETSEKYLRQVKKFIGVDPDLPKDSSLPQRNMRKDHVATEGWQMSRAEYTKLVNLVKPDARSVAKIVANNGFGDYDRWLQNWENVWQRNFDTCDENDRCTITVS